MNILVTGGAGYIGSHACKKLAKMGYKPVVVDNLSCGHKEFVKWGPFYQEDIHNKTKMVEILAKEKISAVMHFAAYALVGESVTDPLKYYQNNVGGTLSLLQAMKEVGVKQIVFSSTCATYGIPAQSKTDSQFMIGEQQEQNPINPYGKSKLMTENILKSVVESDDFHVVTLRYFNASGADSNSEIGEDHKPESHLIPNVIEAAFQDKEVPIFGNDYPTKDGTCVRDYIHVDDLSEAHFQALHFVGKNKGFHAFNLGTSSGSSVLEVIKKTEEVLQKKIKINWSPRRPGDPPSLIADAARAKQILGFVPQKSSLREIIQTASKWYQKRFL